MEMGSFNRASVAGIPAISIPLGEDQNAMPIGLQVMTASFEEEKLFSFAKSFTITSFR